MPRNVDGASGEAKGLRNGEREGVLARIIATTQDSVIFIDAHARVVEFNRSAELTFGYQAREVIGQNVSILMPEPYRAEHDGYLKNYEKTGQARAIGTIRTVKGRRKDGETFPIELSITELPGDSPIRYAAFLRDISDKTALQAQLLERERLASLGMAASILAHEIGNPLNNIYLEAQLLERRLKKTADAGASRSKNIMAEVSRLVRLLDDFRSASRAHQGSFEPCDLAEIAHYTAAQVEMQARTNGVSIRNEAERGAVRVMGSPDKLMQVALNLAKNAIEAMPDGGTLHIGVETTGAIAALTVADTGTGLPDGIDILEAFKTTKSQGTGLGLAIVKQIVTSHRGALSWDSCPGKGATFRVTLPLLE